MTKIAVVLALLLGSEGGMEVRVGWFRIEVPDGAPVTGVFLGRGSVWAGAKVDLDGDGRRETTVRPDLEGLHAFPIEFERGGRTWRVELGAGFVKDDLQGGVSLDWTVSTVEGFALFINGRARLHRTEAEAVRAPLRLGGPFTFRTSAGIRGPDPIVRVGLEDSAGCALRLAQTGGVERRIRVRLLAEGREWFAGDAEYG
jgi:hypothetical protein